MLTPVSRGFATIVVACIGLQAPADVATSTSGNPSIVLQERLGSLFRAERQTIDSLRSRDVARLVEPPAFSEEGQYSRARIDAMPKASGDKNWACLTEALYFEARGESVRGMFGV